MKPNTTTRAPEREKSSGEEKNEVIEVAKARRRKTPVAGRILDTIFIIGILLHIILYIHFYVLPRY